MNQKSYSWNADDYHKHSSVQYEWAQELIRKLYLTGKESILDIGCGDGKVTAMISSCLENGNIIGIDSSADMISLAKKNFPQSEFPNIDFIVMDAVNIGFENQFDISFSNAALHWVKNQAAVLQGVKKSLKKSGRILFQMGGMGNAVDIIDAADKTITNKSWNKYFTNFSFPYAFYSPDEYNQLLIRAGLNPTRSELIPKDMTQKGRDGLAGWIRTTWLPYTERVPENIRDNFIDDIITAYNKIFPVDENGLYHVKMMRLEVEAISK